MKIFWLDFFKGAASVNLSGFHHPDTYHTREINATYEHIKKHYGHLPPKEAIKKHFYTRLLGQWFVFISVLTIMAAVMLCLYFKTSTAWIVALIAAIHFIILMPHIVLKYYLDSSRT